MVVGVLVELSNKNIDKIFDYSVPLDLQAFIKVGIRVEIPFGRQTLEGFVLNIKDETSVSNIKDIIGIVDSEIVLNEELLLLGREIQKNTLSTLISCYQVMLPKALKAKRGVLVNKKFDTYYKLNEDVSLDNLKGKQLEIVNLCKKNELFSKKKSSGILK